MKHGICKGLCLALVLLMVFMLAACGSKTVTPEPTPEPTPVATPDPTPEPTPEPTPMPTVQSIDIHYAGKKLEDFTMKVGETVPLSVSVLPADIPIEVVWSTDEEGESAFEFKLSDTDPTRCDVVCVGPLPEESGGVHIYAQVYGGKASCMVHVIGTDVAYTADKQTVEIRYSLNDEKRTDFTMRVGESVPLIAVPLNEENEETVIWSMDNVAKSALRFVEDKTDPFKVNLECYQALPAGTGGVRIYAELEGVKTACIVYVK